MNISKKGLAFIVDKETGGRAYYEKFLKHPTWPGLQSGVTIGVGYDLGYNTKEQFRKDWTEYLDSDELEVLSGFCGITGRAINLSSIRDIVVPWSFAVSVFNESTVPRFYRQLLSVYPEADRLPPDAAAALLSLVFNRGTALKGDRRTEMVEIQAALKGGNLGEIPDLLRSMKRLWPETAGLRIRRDDEAALFEKAIA
jgi:hypothetical protein